MPVISVEIGKISKEQKTELIRSFTRTAVEITKIPQSAFTVIINEIPDENIGVGGETVEEIKIRLGR
ncbi:MAG TPA: 4-oxalocrotonate tautomerase DmpI [Spirochaetota bacterium]